MQNHEFISKLVSQGILTYLTSEKANPDISAWLVATNLPSPSLVLQVPTKFYFGIAELDEMLQGISGLWEFHGKKASGKTYLCKSIAKNSNAEVLYINISGALCHEFLQGLVIFTQSLEKITVFVHFNLKSLICCLYSFVEACKFEIIIIEGLSALLFIEEEQEIVKELESVLKRISTKALVITTRISNDNGNLIGNHLWNGAMTNEIHLRNIESTLFEAIWYKYSIKTAKFTIT